jgi:hypothetical protein
MYTQRVGKHWPGSGCAVPEKAVVRLCISLPQSPCEIRPPKCVSHGRSAVFTPYT